MIIQVVRYASGLSHEEVAERFEARSGRYREVSGLVQKYYVRYPATVEYGGIYVWDSPESFEAWQSTNLAGTLAETYRTEGPPQVELTEVMLTLHPDRLRADVRGGS